MVSLATLCIVPRERFSFSRRSLESILEHTPRDVQIVYVDGNSPPAMQEYLRSRCIGRNIRLLREDTFLSPNVARNMAAEQVRTKYVTFVDNDVLVTPGWLERLIECAESTNAWAVGPLYCQGEPAGTQVHMAGGMAQFYAKEGQRFFREAHTHCGRPTAEIKSSLLRNEVELLEFHTMLVRMDAFQRFGPLDEELLSVHEHVDLCLTLREAGRGVYMEPKSVVTYVGPQPLDEYDRAFFKLRWCDAWNRLSMQRFQEKWDVSPNDPGLNDVLEWATHHRCEAQSLWHTVLRPLGRKRARRIIAACEAPISRTCYQPVDCLPGRPYSGKATIPHSLLRAA